MGLHFQVNHVSLQGVGLWGLHSPVVKNLNSKDLQDEATQEAHHCVFFFFFFPAKMGQMGSRSKEMVDDVDRFSREIFI